MCFSFFFEVAPILFLDSWNLGGNWCNSLIMYHFLMKKKDAGFKECPKLGLDIILDLFHSVIALVEPSSKGRGRGFNYWLTTPLISSM